VDRHGSRVAVFLVLFLLPLQGWAESGSLQERILTAFFPYRQGPPRVEGITPGMKIDATNAQVAESVLPPEILTPLAAGDFAITVQETTNLPVRQEYVEATLKHYGQVSAGEGEPQHYVAGRPFPLIDPQDPEAGVKVAWNMRYRDQGETAQMWATNEMRNAGGATERSQSFYFVSMYGMHRPEADKNISQWEQQGVYAKQYSRMLAPADMEGNQILSLVYNDNTLSDDQWVYDPRTRRTRKIVYNPYDAPGGGETLIEDRSGFLGHIHHYDWKYVGEQVVLVPGPIKATEATWGGKGNWYPLDPWELRRVMVVEATPKGSHPLYSRRVLYIDVQTSAVLYSLTYDHAGNHRRSFLMVYRHPDFNPWDNTDWFAQVAAQSSIDYQRDRATIFQIHKILHNRPISESRFSVMALMLYGK
jgi:hypothetical protein